jgi:hypothetical protein
MMMTRELWCGCDVHNCSALEPQQIAGLLLIGAETLPAWELIRHGMGPCCVVVLQQPAARMDGAVSPPSMRRPAPTSTTPPFLQNAVAQCLQENTQKNTESQSSCWWVDMQAANGNENRGGRSFHAEADRAG